MALSLRNVIRGLFFKGAPGSMATAAGLLMKKSPRCFQLRAVVQPKPYSS